MNEAYLSLGSNEGDREDWMKKALALLSSRCGALARESAMYETDAWGITSQPKFLNMAVCLRTLLPPQELLAAILEIEITLGRYRVAKWGPRTIDIDILFYNNIVLETAELTIPHPFLQERRFILTPLAAIAPNLVHPRLHKTIRELLSECTDPLMVNVHRNKL